MIRTLTFFCMIFLATSAYGQSGYGRVLFVTEPDTLYVQMQTVQMKLATADTLSLPAGEYVFIVMAKGYADKEARMVIQEGTMRNYMLPMKTVVKREYTQEVSSLPYYEWAKTIHVETDLDSKIEVNGVELEGTDWMVLADAGWVNVKVTHPLGRTRQVRAEIRENRLNSLDLHIRMTRKEHLINSLLPGYSHFRKQQYVRMVVAPTAVLAFIGLSAQSHLTYLTQKSEYDKLRRDYFTSVPSQADAAARRAQLKADEANATLKQRDIFVASTIAAYLISYADGVRPGKIGYRVGGMRLDPYVESNPNGDGFMHGFKLSKSF